MLGNAAASSGASGGCVAVVEGGLTGVEAATEIAETYWNWRCHDAFKRSEMTSGTLPRVCPRRARKRPAPHPQSSTRVPDPHPIEHLLVDRSSPAPRTFPGLGPVAGASTEERSPTGGAAARLSALVYGRHSSPSSPRAA
jgi:hypothetical protein